MTDKDYRIEVKVRNNWLLKRIEDAGFDTIASFSRSSKIPQSIISAYITFRETPKRPGGEWRESFLKIAEALRCLPEDICPPQHLDKGLKKNKASFEADVVEVAGYLSGSFECAKPAIENIIKQEEEREISSILSQILTPKEERVVRMRFGLVPDGEVRTLQQVGEECGVQRERVRQIEARALRKLKHPKSSRSLCDISFAPKYIREPDKSRHYVPEWKRKEKKQEEEMLRRPLTTYGHMIRCFYGD